MYSQSPGQNPLTPLTDDALSSFLSTSDHFSPKKSKWTPEEDDLLRKYSQFYGERQWRKVSQKIPGKTSIQCLHRWTKILKPGLVKGAWTTEEDQKLFTWVKENGPNKWSQAAKLIQGRSGKQCRERWFNNLSPDVKKTEWTKEEDDLISELYQQYGTSWSQLAKHIPGRTENSIKNRYYSTLRRMATQNKKKNRVARLMAQNDQIKEEDGTEEVSLELKNDQVSPDSFQVNGSFMYGPVSSLDELFKDTTMQNQVKVAGREMMMLMPDKVNSLERMDPYRLTPEKRLYQELEISTNSKSRHSSGKKNLKEDGEKDFDSFSGIEAFDMMSPVIFGDYNSKINEKSLETDAGTDVENSHFCSKQNSKVSSDEFLNPTTFLSPLKPVHPPQSLQHMQTMPHMPSMQQPMLQQMQQHMQPPSQSTFGQSLDMNQHGYHAQNGYMRPERVTEPQQMRYYPQNNNSEPAVMKQQNTANFDSNFYMLPQRITEKCVSQNVDGVQRVMDLIGLFKSFNGQSLQTLGYMSQTLGASGLKEFLMNMQKAIRCSSNVHCKYIQNLLSIARSMPQGNVGEVNGRMEYLYVQLSSLENLLIGAKELVSKLETVVYGSSNNSTGQNYGNYKENMERNHVVDPMYRNEGYRPNAIKIRIGTHNSGLEEISKKRALG